MVQRYRNSMTTCIARFILMARLLAHYPLLYVCAITWHSTHEELRRDAEHKAENEKNSCRSKFQRSQDTEKQQTRTAMHSPMALCRWVRVRVQLCGSSLFRIVFRPNDRLNAAWKTTTFRPHFPTHEKPLQEEVACRFRRAPKSSDKVLSQWTHANNRRGPWRRTRKKSAWKIVLCNQEGVENGRLPLFRRRQSYTKII